MPDIFTDGSSDVDEGELNKNVHAGGTATGVQIIVGRIQYDGAAWDVVPGSESWFLEDADLVWSTDKLTINLTGYGFTNVPIVLLTPILGDSVYWPKGHATSTSNIDVAFYNDAGARQSTESTNMDFQIVIIGR